MLLDFLREHDAETVYLVGDIVDGWRLKRSWFWPQAHNDVVQKLLRKSRKEGRIVGAVDAGAGAVVAPAVRPAGGGALGDLDTLD